MVASAYNRMKQYMVHWNQCACMKFISYVTQQLGNTLATLTDIQALDAMIPKHIHGGSNEAASVKGMLAY